MSIRLRRLQADYENIQAELAGHKYIKVHALEGNPPERYLVKYHVKGLKLVDDHPVECNYHEVEIYLTNDYPREKPQCVIRTEIFHPNFQNRGAVCFGDHWAAGESLVDVIIQIGQMIQFQSYNPKSPLNALAANWCMTYEHLLPIDHTDLYQPDPEFRVQTEDSDIDIEFI